MIAAKMGYAKSLKAIKDMSVQGHATVEQYAEAMKGYQVSTDEMKSPERDEAAVLLSEMREDDR